MPVSVFVALFLCIAMMHRAASRHSASRVVMAYSRSTRHPRRALVPAFGTLPRYPHYSHGHLDTTTTTTRRSLTQLRSAASHAAAAASLEEDEDTSTLANNQHQQHMSQPVTTTDSIPQDENTLYEGLKSRPVPGGNWNPEAPLDWCKDFGSRSAETWKRLQPLIKLQPGDDGYVKYDPNETVEGVTLVRTKEKALQVLDKLMAAPRHTTFHACDTEVMALDLKKQGPVGNGYVTCLSVYSGPDFDYGEGPGKRLWIDNLDDACGIVNLFQPWLESEDHYKVWHNYGFDRHVLWNEGILVKGFGGDTMHMARLQDTSRSHSSGGYSLESLTDVLCKRRKKPMKELFGVKRKRKDGSDGLIVDIPPVETLQRDAQFRQAWIEYSAFDAEGTWLLRQELQRLLEAKPWCRGKNLYEYYQMHMRPFGEVLTDMERRGIRVDARDYLASVEVQAREDRARHLEAFHKWAQSKIGADGLALNPASSVQLTTFLFGGAKNIKTNEPTEDVRVFKVPREEISDAALEAYRERNAVKRNEASGEWYVRQSAGVLLFVVLEWLYLTQSCGALQIVKKNR